MDAEKAIDHFYGRNGARRLNCAQSVAIMLEREGVFSHEEFEALAGCGNGRAPEGYCGGVFAAISALEKIGADSVAQFETQFAARASSLKCEEIKRARVLTCSQCVAYAAELVSAIYQKRQLCAQQA